MNETGGIEEEGVSNFVRDVVRGDFFHQEKPKVLLPAFHQNPTVTYTLAMPNLYV